MTKREMEEYTNDESQRIEDFLNKTRKQLIKDGLPPECMPYEVKVIFMREKGSETK